jgi:hypothetical protein
LTGLERLDNQRGAPSGKAGGKKFPALWLAVPLGCWIESKQTTFYEAENKNWDLNHFNIILRDNITGFWNYKMICCSPNLLLNLYFFSVFAHCYGIFKDFTEVLRFKSHF